MVRMLRFLNRDLLETHCTEWASKRIWSNEYIRLHRYSRISLRWLDFPAARRVSYFISDKSYVTGSRMPLSSSTSPTKFSASASVSMGKSMSSSSSSCSASLHVCPKFRCNVGTAVFNRRRQPPFMPLASKWRRHMRYRLYTCIGGFFATFSLLHAWSHLLKRITSEKLMKRKCSFSVFSRTDFDYVVLLQHLWLDVETDGRLHLCAPSVHDLDIQWCSTTFLTLSLYLVLHAICNHQKPQLLFTNPDHDFVSNNAAPYLPSASNSTRLNFLYTDCAVIIFANQRKIEHWNWDLSKSNVVQLF